MNVNTRIRIPTVLRFFSDLEDAITRPKAYAVSGQLVIPSARRYRQMKRAWTRRGRDAR